eukprot:COSAG05_NODE_12148_length_481_cov_1.065445_1_plen_68_part_10
MVEIRETETARTLLRNTAAMQELRVHDLDRYRHIEDILSSSYFDAAQVGKANFVQLYHHNNYCCVGLW